jgi:hypothetical protein
MREPTARARGREARREVAALVVEAKKPLLLALDEVAPPGGSPTPRSPSPLPDSTVAHGRSWRPGSRGLTRTMRGRSATLIASST